MEAFGFDEAAALSCDDGWGGMKYPIKSIEIVSNNDFDSTHPAAASLNDLFRLRTYDNRSSFTDDPIPTSGELSVKVLVIISTARPNMSMNHVFTIKITKSNDEIVIVETPSFEWQ